jgi:hypothetical protein
VARVFHTGLRNTVSPGESLCAVGRAYAPRRLRCAGQPRSLERGWPIRRTDRQVVSGRILIAVNVDDPLIDEIV